MNTILSFNDFLSILPAGLIEVSKMAFIAVIYLTVFAVLGLYLVLLERKVAAWFQLRLGPKQGGLQRYVPNTCRCS